MKSSLKMQIRGKQLHVEVVGPETAPTMLYLHGGPGGLGCLDFMATQAPALARAVRVVAFDQRGTLRSEGYADGERISLHELIADAEALRVALGVERWAVLGHSYGGYLAVLYALVYPQSVTALLLESPTFSFTLSEQSLLRKNAALFAEMGDAANAARCLALAEVDEPHDAVLWELGNLLGERAGGVMHAGEDWQFLNRIAAAAGLPGEVWANSARTRALVLAEGSIYASVIPRLGDLAVPALLMKGEHDPITCEKQVAAFAARGRVERFANAGHWIRHEEAARYTETVLSFLASL
ncbi:MAG: proline iminopeptidase [Symbiobacteriaceae bacterium]|jgi:proline iminopeptidase|nr:proline iminopeptidase [Symbiobacteriaceae bacterium]